MRRSSLRSSVCFFVLLGCQSFRYNTAQPTKKINLSKNWGKFQPFIIKIYLSNNIKTVHQSFKPFK